MNNSRSFKEDKKSRELLVSDLQDEVHFELTSYGCVTTHRPDCTHITVKLFLLDLNVISFSSGKLKIDQKSWPVKL